MPGFNVAGNPNNNLQPSITLGRAGDVFRNHRWRVNSIVDIASKPDGPLIYAKSITSPTVSFEEETVNGGSINYKFAKTVTYPDVTIEFYDVYGLYDELYDKMKATWNPASGIAKAADYMGVTSFSLFTNEGTEKAVWRLKNSYIKELSSSALAYDNNELKTVSVVISYAWFEYDSYNISPSGVAIAQ